MELKNDTFGWKQMWDDESSTPFAINGEKVVTYDDERSIAEKVKFAMSKNLAGCMVWSLETDDFLGDCSQKTQFNNYPLMRSINKAIEDSLNEISKNKQNEIPHGDVRTNSSSKMQNFVMYLAFGLLVLSFA